MSKSQGVRLPLLARAARDLVSARIPRTARTSKQTEQALPDNGLTGLPISTVQRMQAGFDGRRANRTLKHRRGRA